MHLVYNTLPLPLLSQLIYVFKALPSDYLWMGPKTLNILTESIRSMNQTQGVLYPPVSELQEAPREKLGDDD